MTPYLTVQDIVSHAIDELMDEEIDERKSGISGIDSARYGVA